MAADNVDALSLTTLIKECLDASRHLSKTTIKGYRWYLRSFAAWAGTDARLETLTEERLLAYFDYLCRTHPSGNPVNRPRSVATKWSGVSYFCRWLTEKNRLPKNSLPRVKMPQLDAALRPKTSRADILLLLDACDQLDAYHRAMGRAILYLLFISLVRCSELLHIQIPHLNMEDRNAPILHVVCGKGGKERKIGLSDECVRAVNEYLKHRNPDCQHNYLLAHPNRQWRLAEKGLYSLLERISRLAGFENEKSHKPHAMRRGGASLMLRSQTDIDIVRQKLGHSKLTTTQMYTEANLDAQVAARNVVLLEPPAPLPGIESTAPPQFSPESPLMPTLRPMDIVPALPIYGWICPRCSEVNAPSVTRCLCTSSAPLRAEAVVTQPLPKPIQ